MILFDLQGGRASSALNLTEIHSLQIQDIVRRRQLLTIFREGKDGQQDVDVAILQALLKGEARSQNMWVQDKHQHLSKVEQLPCHALHTPVTQETQQTPSEMNSLTYTYPTTVKLSRGNKS